ncbi:MAG TPA: SDR family oxidoreductase [Armatimonadota bacterium]|jgi:3-oxoacyl-[acyl-carrier protein] reductase
MADEGLRLDLSGKIAIVTGGSGDLGRVMVRTLAACGADVAVHYHRNRQMAERLVEDVRSTGRRAIAVCADVTDREAVMAMCREVSAGLGAPDIVVNNAVAQYAWTSVLEQGAEDFEGQFRSSVLHNVFMAQAFIPGMIEKGGGGRVIGINSECAMQCFASQSAYAAGKRGMDGVLRVLAREVGSHGITVNQVAPGWTISDRNRDVSEADEGYISSVPLGRRGEAQEIANVVAFLASDLASFITGTYIPVCGGNVMPGI